MMKILKLLALLLVLFVFVTEILPRIRGRVEGITEDKIMGRPELVAGDASACVRLAQEVADTTADAARSIKPPPADSSDWVEMSDEIRYRITEADDECTCPGSGCRTARQALEEIHQLVSDIDRMISGELSGAISLANRQERIGSLLEQARVEAR